MPKPAKPIYISTLYVDMKSFYHSKSIKGQKLKRHLEETQKIIDYHSYHNQKFLKLDDLFNTMILNNIIKQFDKPLYGLNSNIFCHGLAGTYYLLTKLKEDGIIDYDTEKIHRNKLEKYIIQLIENDGEIDYLILTGDVSIVMTLLAIDKNPQYNIFSKFVFLD